MAAERLAAALADRYRLERELGAGGMATVYQAEDLRHGRRVAIKVLRPELAAVIGAERFVREIRTIAALQHPHILGLIDSGKVDGTAYYVMPFVEGESLRDRLDREKQLPVGDAVRIATEVASALDYAHRHGVIHRDIKPENILLHDGAALVADFGIALAVRTAGATRMTETGMSLGTPHYMSPEQAMGEREITARSDVYALGVVTYEMLTGDPPFTGSTAQAIVARVMTEAPRPIVAQRHTVPPEVEDAVLTALEKLPADRFASAADFAAALSGALHAPAAQSRRPSAPRAAQHRWATWLPARVGPAALAVMAAVILGAFLLGTRVAARSDDGGTTFGRATPVTWDPGLEVHPAISPDGRLVAYAAGPIAPRLRVYVRPVAGGRAVALVDDTSATQSSPRWSPDGTRVLFLMRGGVFSAPSFGGPARPEVPAPPAAVTWADWSPDGRRIAFTAGDSIYVRTEGDTTRVVAAVFEPALCDWSPSGRTLVCASGNLQYAAASLQFANLSPSRLVLVDLGSGAVDTLADASAANQSPVWTDDDHIVFVSNRHGPRDIYALDVSRRGRAGEPRRLTTGLGAHTVSLSADGGRMAYAAISATSNVWSVPMPADGQVSPYGGLQITHGNQLVESFTVSPDGRWLLYDSDLAGNADIYRVRVTGGEPERLATDPSDDFFPAASPDGREVAFHSWRTGNRDVFVQPLDGGPLQQVTDTPDRQEVTPSWSPDGSALVFFEFEGQFLAESRRPVWMARRAANGRWSAPVQLAERGAWPSWSRDGRLAYAAGGISRRIYVAEADGTGPSVVYDAEAVGGPMLEQVVWSADGRSLLFKSHDADGRASIWSVRATGGPLRLIAFFDDLARSSYRFTLGVDSARIYFPIDERRSDVWVMEVEGR